MSYNTHIAFSGADQNANSGDWTTGALQISARASRLHDLVAFNKSASVDAYLQIFDSASGASGNPKLVLPVPAGSFVAVSYSGGRRFSAGIYARCVTTADGSTAVGTDILLDANYRDGVA